MNELVRHLSSPSRVEIRLRPTGTASALKRRIEQYGFVHIAFTETRGGTELGVRLDRQACDLGSGDFEGARGTITLKGYLTLDYVPVQCVAEIDLTTLQGIGTLHIVETAGNGHVAAADANAGLG